MCSVFSVFILASLSTHGRSFHGDWHDFIRGKGKLCAWRSDVHFQIRMVDRVDHASLRINYRSVEAVVETPIDVNQIPSTGHEAKKKCKARESLNDAYWKMRRPNYPCAATTFLLLDQTCSVPRSPTRFRWFRE
jgi:hypothetical protein